jgi:hypothetical protein
VSAKNLEKRYIAEIEELDISKHHGQEDLQLTSIAMYGYTSTIALFLLGIISTIRMVTKETTVQIISNAFILMNTQWSIT